ncbi:type II CRISPR RNA-guided endonuclease Cas9 [Mesoplasma corruscae]|uniref:CRISPR-associated endonuclease Cas9 n=1 Tax=Mesoplasma corruscae TaxID=216874 RepID=A0A2S5REF1_9MOLU|nr:type II CRISPR RNA-guided endonuclease Cas9 [Mesoplasma corruscae]PPE05668.1 CRISPR-associated protein Cas9 [Mesoplasma corruscae]
MKKVNIGLDIGIASVGWAIVNADKFEIIDAGSRIFNEANNTNYQTAASTRENRSKRRQYRRNKLRREDLIRLFIKYEIINSPDDLYSIFLESENLLFLRKKGLTEELTKEEIIVVLFNYMKRRGTFNFVDDLIDESIKSNKDDNISVFNENEEILPIDIQLKSFNETGKFRGSGNRLITHKMYSKEIELLLNKQIHFKLISKNFANDYLELFNRKREFYTGPGPGSKWGWNQSEEEFYKRLLGRDLYNYEELRAPKFGIYANLYNLLNDLNNLEISDSSRQSSKISFSEKEQIINFVFDFSKGKQNNITINSLAKILKVNVNQISKYRINSSQKPEFTKFEALGKIIKILVEKNFDYSWINFDNIDSIDKVVEILSTRQSYETRSKEISQVLVENKITQSKEISETLAFIKLSGTHSLSNKTIKILINEMMDSNKNAQALFSSLNMKKKTKFKFNNNSKTIPVYVSEINEMFISPVVKRSFIQALKILKEIQRKYPDYLIDEIVIELAREKNEKDFKEFINKKQKNNEQNNKDIKDIIMQHGANIPFNKKNIQKVKLWIEQNHKCIYCFEELDLKKVINSNYVDIDHIIPESISFTSSMDNLVLAHSIENSVKNNLTPFKYFSSKKSSMSWNDFKNSILNDFYDENKTKINKKYFNRKIDNLLNENDFSKQDTKDDFINRNLNDTRYATVLFKEYLEQYKNTYQKKFKIKTINGSVTHNFRTNYFYLDAKNRDDFKHHAIDAIVLSYSSLIMNESNNKEQWAYQKVLINNFDYRFSKMKTNNYNKKQTDETLYSFRKSEDGEFRKILTLDLFNSGKEKLNEIFNVKPENVLMYKQDRQSFEYLKKIFNDFIDMKYVKEYTDKDKKIQVKELIVKNPFIYVTEELGYKIVKQNTSSEIPIKSIKYIGNKSNKLLNISHKYSNISSDKIVGFESLKPLRIDFYRDKKTKNFRMCLVNVNDVKNIVSDKEIKIDPLKYQSHLKSLKIDDNFDFYLSVQPSDTIAIKVNNEWTLWYAVGGQEPGTFEVKRFHRNILKSNEEKVGNNRDLMSTSRFQDIKLLNIDILGIKSSKYVLK